jgi:hypothetical protein
MRPDRRHPLCTCAPVTFDGPAPDRSKCAGGTIAHPVLTVDDLAKLIKRVHGSGNGPSTQ